MIICERAPASLTGAGDPDCDLVSACHGGTCVFPSWSLAVPNLHLLWRRKQKQRFTEPLKIAEER